jgi:hypothetical protein
MGTATQGKPLRAHLATAFGCLLAASGAAQEPVPATALTYGPVLVSTLVSRGDVPFKAARVREPAGRLTVLAHVPAAGEPIPVAAIRETLVDKVPRFSVERLPLHPADSAGLELPTIEHLYTLVLRMDPEARYCLPHRVTNCDGLASTISHGEALAELARARQQAVARANRAGKAAPWRIVSMARSAIPAADPDEAAVRVVGPDGPLQGASIFFHRAPHSSCSARVSADGLAKCHLVDQHGDDDAHAGEGQVPVVATFPGHIHADRVLLPTTLVIRPAP